MNQQIHVRTQNPKKDHKHQAMANKRGQKGESGLQRMVSRDERTTTTVMWPVACGLSSNTTHSLSFISCFPLMHYFTAPSTYKQDLITLFNFIVTVFYLSLISFSSLQPSPMTRHVKIQRHWSCHNHLRFSSYCFLFQGLNIRDDSLLSSCDASSIYTLRNKRPPYPYHTLHI